MRFINWHCNCCSTLHVYAVDIFAQMSSKMVLWPLWQWQPAVKFNRCIVCCFVTKIHPLVFFFRFSCSCGRKYMNIEIWGCKWGNRPKGIWKEVADGEGPLTVEWCCACRTTYHLQADRHHLQDMFHWHSGFPIKPYLSLHTSAYFEIFLSCMSYVSTRAICGPAEVVFEGQQLGIVHRSQWSSG